MKTKYTVGLAFSDSSPKHVLLLKKNRPVWQVGFLNGPGGKVDSNETLRECLVREFEEEVGIATSMSAWDRKVVLTDISRNTEISFFSIKLEDFWNFQMKTDEKPIPVQVDRLSLSNALPSIKWIVPFILAKETNSTLKIHDYNPKP